MGCSTSKAPAVKAAEAKDVQPEADKTALQMVPEEKEAQPEAAAPPTSQGEPEPAPEAATPTAEDATPPPKVTVVGARGLRNADWVGTSEPYVVVEIAGKTESKTQTPCVKHAAEVEWNFGPAELAGYKVGDAIVFTVWDADLGKPDDLLGTVTLAEDKIKANFEGELELTGAGKDCQAFLTVKVEATAGMAKVQDAAENLYEEVKEVLQGKGDTQDVKEAAKDLATALHETVEQVAFNDREADDDSKNQCCNC